MSVTRPLYPLLELQDRHAWRAWLEENHARSRGVRIVVCKKHGGARGLSYEEVVEEALCFGWIDSATQALDAEHFVQCVTPRKPGSIWAKSNKARVAKLIRRGLMTPAGLEKIRAAKQDGSWTRLDAVESLRLPPDLKKALAANNVAQRNFAAWSASSKKMVLWWIASAKRPETRAKRIQETVRSAEKNKRAPV